MSATNSAFRSDSLSVLITDFESSPIATSLLFNHALAIGNADGCSTIVRPESLETLPLRLFDSPDQPPMHQVRKLEFLYLADRSEFIDYVSNIHESGVPACFIIDSTHTYTTGSIVHLASVMALLHDLGKWIKEQRTVTDLGQELSPVVCALSIDRSEHEKTIRLVNRYAKSVWRLHAAEEVGKFLYYHIGEESRIILKVQNDRVLLVEQKNPVFD